MQNFDHLPREVIEACAKHAHEVADYAFEQAFHAYRHDDEDKGDALLQRANEERQAARRYEAALLLNA